MIFVCYFEKNAKVAVVRAVLMDANGEKLFYFL